MLKCFLVFIAGQWICENQSRPSSSLALYYISLLSGFENIDYIDEKYGNPNDNLDGQSTSPHLNFLAIFIFMASVWRSQSLILLDSAWWRCQHILLPNFFTINMINTEIEIFIDLLLIIIIINYFHSSQNNLVKQIIWSLFHHRQTDRHTYTSP